MTQRASESCYFPSAVTIDSEGDHNLRKQSRINLDNDSVAHADRLAISEKPPFALCLQSRQDGHSRAAMDAFLRDH